VQIGSLTFMLYGSIFTVLAIMAFMTASRFILAPDHTLRQLEEISAIDHLKSLKIALLKMIDEKSDDAGEMNTTSTLKLQTLKWIELSDGASNRSDTNSSDIRSVAPVIADPSTKSISSTSIQGTQTGKSPVNIFSFYYSTASKITMKKYPS
jgi:predicted DNA-binding ribbon-helix-helix protein